MSDFGFRREEHEAPPAAGTTAAESEKRSDWKPGDPCGACGSTNTGENGIEGGFCRDCGACDSDE